MTSDTIILVFFVKKENGRNTSAIYCRNEELTVEKIDLYRQCFVQKQPE